MLYYERKLRQEGFDIIIGVDEAGRGPLAGPVVAGAVFLKSWRFKNRIDDSKKLSAPQREKALAELSQKSVFAVGITNERAIDRFNILEATRMAMEQAVSLLLKAIKKPAEKKIHILVDGNMKLSTSLDFTAIIKGDSKSKSIAAASIIAKVTRDRIMSLYHNLYPQYGFLRHKGYPTRMHRQAIEKFGMSIIHRETFICQTVS
ncbi:MAG: ribonuclease HII [Candidatus Omnitrophica bacterium]|nr:ribonuclease HII [Candidatus Omnitrophota bacterium]